MADETLVWTAPPSRRRPVVFLVAALAAILGWLLVHQPLVALLGPVMILGATADVWMGIHFRLDAKGASARIGPSVTAMKWPEVRRILIDGNEVRLSPLETASALDAFRGVTLRTTRENQEAVLALIAVRAPSAPLSPLDRGRG